SPVHVGRLAREDRLSAIREQAPARGHGVVDVHVKRARARHFVCSVEIHGGAHGKRRVPRPELLFVGDRGDGRIVIERLAKERTAAGIGGPAVDATGGSTGASGAAVTPAAGASTGAGV